VDFVWKKRGAGVTAVECKWSADKFDPSGISAFRRIYKDGSNYVVAFDVKRPFLRSYNGHKLEFVNLEHLIQKI
jgi:hypothetical protein